MFGFTRNDNRLNECGVVIKANNPCEYIDLLDGVAKKSGEELEIVVVKTPDGHYLIGLSAYCGLEGMSYSPSIGGTAYDSREEAVRAGANSLRRFIMKFSSWEKIAENARKAIKGNEQPELF